MNKSGGHPLSAMIVHTGTTIQNNNDDNNNMAVEEQGIPPPAPVNQHTTAPINNNPATDIEYVELRKEDILCGRGSGPNERLGNIEFRNLVLSRKEEYVAIPARDHADKTRIAHEVIATIKEKGARFLKYAPKKPAVEGQPREPDRYILADEKTILEKTKQALRQHPSAGRRERQAAARQEKRERLERERSIFMMEEDTKRSAHAVAALKDPTHNAAHMSHNAAYHNAMRLQMEQHQKTQQMTPGVLSQRQYQERQKQLYADMQPSNNGTYHEAVQKPGGYIYPSTLPGQPHPYFGTTILVPTGGVGAPSLNGHTMQPQSVASNGNNNASQASKKQQQHQDVSLATQLQNPNQRPSIDLPDGWRCVWSKTQQRWYFFHERMGSCWDLTSVASAIQAAGRDTTSTSAMGVHAMNSSSLQETQAAHLLDQESIGTQNQQMREQFKKQLKQRHKSTSAAQGTSITSYEQKQIQQENAAIASTLLARGLSDDHTIGTISISGRSCGSTLETMALEKFLIDGQSSTQRSVASVGSRLSKAKRHCKNSIRGGDSGSDLIDGLEDMSLPSMSLGDVSEFGASTVMSKRRLSRGGGSKDSLGGGSKTIAEGSENSGSSHSDAFQEEAAKARDYISRQKSSAASVSSSVEEIGSVESNNRMEAVAALTLMSVSSPQPSKASSVSSKETTNRSVSFVEDMLGIRQAAPPQPVAVPVAAAPAVNMETEQAHVHESDTQLVDTSRKKKRKQKRQSLSSYYREVRASDNCEMDIDESGE